MGSDSACRAPVTRPGWRLKGQLNALAAFAAKHPPGQRIPGAYPRGGMSILSGHRRMRAGASKLRGCRSPRDYFRHLTGEPMHLASGHDSDRCHTEVVLAFDWTYSKKVVSKAKG